MSEANSQPDVVVVGSTNIDLVMQVARLPAPGETVGDAVFSQALGGKGANQALAAARSGANVSFVSVVGDDDYGRNARASFAAEGIDVTHMTTSEEPTGTALIFVDRQAENCIGVAPGANAACDVTTIERTRELFHRARVVLLQLEIPLESVRTVLNLPIAARTILNAAPMLDLNRDDVANLDTLVVNQTELVQLAERFSIDGQADGAVCQEDACEMLHEAGVTNIVVTLGEKGVFLSVQGEQRSFPGFSVDAVDTTGAGDTFCGALAARLASQTNLEEAVTYAQAAAALACTELGAQSAIPEKYKVEAFIARNLER